MTKTEQFERHVDRYEQWFLDSPLADLSAIKAIQALLPKSGEGMAPLFAADEPGEVFPQPGQGRLVQVRHVSGLVAGELEIRAQGRVELEMIESVLDAGQGSGKVVMAGGDEETQLRATGERPGEPLAHI